MKIDGNKKRYLYVSKKQGEIVKNKQRIKPSSLAKKVLLKGENVREFEELRAQVLSETGTQSKIDDILCEKIISTLWKLRRAAEVERNLLNKENEITFEERHPGPYERPGRKRICNIDRVVMGSEEVQNIIHYQIELEKMLQKMIKQLKTEQSKYVEEPDSE